MASSSHIKPGEKGKINAKVDTEGRAGYLQKPIAVYSNDPKRPIVHLYISAILK